jgi:Protein of unknown function (DUF3276)
MSEIFSEKVMTSRRTYFFDVKETKDGSKYLVIGELTQVGSELERHRVMVFEESLDLFVDGLDKAVEFIRYGDSSEEGAGGNDEVSAGGADRDIRQVLERIERGSNDIRQHFK